MVLTSTEPFLLLFDCLQALPMSSVFSPDACDSSPAFVVIIFDAVLHVLGLLSASVFLLSGCSSAKKLLSAVCPDSPFSFDCWKSTGLLCH